jgi:hypothetical protein
MRPVLAVEVDRSWIIPFGNLYLQRDENCVGRLGEAPYRNW